MKFSAFFALCLAAGSAVAQMQMAPKPPALMSGLSNLHHPVSTSSVEAQPFFDQGLRLVYAFNLDEAARRHPTGSRRPVMRKTELHPRGSGE